MLIQPRPPAWIKPYRPIYQWDYEHGRYYGTTIDRGYPPVKGSMCASTYSVADVITGLTKAGKVQLMKLREIRATDYGLWAENVRNAYLLHSRDMTITHQLSITGQIGTFQDGETVTSTGGGTGTYVAGNSNLTVSPRLFAIRDGTGTLSGTLIGSTSGATGTISATVLVWQRNGVTVTKNQVGNDTVGAANQACLITATTNNAQIFQAVTLTSSQFNYSAYARRATGTGSIYMTQDNFSTLTDITSQLGSSYSRGEIPAATLTNPVVGFQLANATDTIVVDFNHADGSSYATTPIITKTAQIAVTTDEPLMNDIDNGNYGYVIIREKFILQPITVLVEFSSKNYDNVQILCQGSGTSVKMNITTSGQLNCTNSASSTAQTSGSTFNLGYDAVNRAIASVSGSKISVCLNGGTVASNTGKFLATGTYDHLGIGNSASYVNSINGFTRCLTVWPKALGDTELQMLTR